MHAAVVAGRVGCIHTLEFCRCSASLQWATLLCICTNTGPRNSTQTRTQNWSRQIAFENCGANDLRESNKSKLGFARVAMKKQNLRYFSLNVLGSIVFVVVVDKWGFAFAIVKI